MAVALVHLDTNQSVRPASVEEAEFERYGFMKDESVLSIPLWLIKETVTNSEG